MFAGSFFFGLISLSLCLPFTIGHLQLLFFFSIRLFCVSLACVHWQRSFCRFNHGCKRDWRCVIVSHDFTPIAFRNDVCVYSHRKQAKRTPTNKWWIVWEWVFPSISPSLIQLPVLSLCSLSSCRFPNEWERESERESEQVSVHLWKVARGA